MGHQFARAAAAGAVAVILVACGGTELTTQEPDVLENARRQAEEASPRPASADADDTRVDTSGDTRVVVDELPSPDPATFVGANRLVNLWTDVDGAVRPVDVWARRTFDAGPVLLVADIEHGRVSPYVAAPPAADIVVVGTGAGPDAEALAEIVGALDGEQITTVLTNTDRRGGVDAVTVWEIAPERSPEPPAAGRGLVLVTAVNIRAFGDELIESVGADAYDVGDGSAGCRVQRGELVGFRADVLGPSRQVEVETEPGPATFSLHPSFASNPCAEPSVLDVAVDVLADAAVLVLVHSVDGGSLSSLVVPVR